MTELLKQLKVAFPHLKFVAGKQFCWSPETGEIIYKKVGRSVEDSWSLLHETGHALLGHTTYGADIELVRLEVDAWEKAVRLAKKFQLKIDEDHIQDCLDTYRDWLYGRSVCPDCGAKCLQQRDIAYYRCFNCHKKWQVSSNRFGRSYRQTKKISAGAEILFT